HGAYDIAFMRCIPNMTLAAPMNAGELRNMMYTAQLENIGPYYLRYQRGNGVKRDWKRQFQALPVVDGRKRGNCEEVAILRIGHIGNEVSKAIVNLNTEAIYPAHYDIRYVKPIDEDLLHEVFKKFSKIITVEDGVLPGGFGSAVIEFMANNNYSAQVVRLGIPDEIVEHGEQAELWSICNYDAQGIQDACKKLATIQTTHNQVG